MWRALACSLALGLGLSPLSARAGDWTITPQVGGQEIYTDNVLLTPLNPRSDFITTLSPGISINGESARLKGIFSYSPTLYRYANTPSLDAVRQHLYANGTATLIPRHLFLDARGFISEIPTTPGLALFNQQQAFLSALGPNFFGIGSSLSPALPKAALTQATSFSASPYFVESFSDYGTAELRYTVTESNFSGEASSLFTPTGFAPSSGSTLTNEGTVSFLTGNRLGPLSSLFTFDTERISGTGSLSRASHNIALLDTAYAIDRRLAAVATIGYEDIQFHALPPTHISDAVWAVGARLTPNANSSITARYGHQAGITGPFLDARYALTARTTLFASYREGLGTSIESLENALALSTLNPQGQSINPLTGIPELIPNSLLGLQNALFRSKDFKAGGFVNLARDQFSLSVYKLEHLVVATAVSGTGVSERAIGGNASWVHNLTPLLTASVGLGYSRLTFPSSITPNLKLISGGASVSYLLTQSLSSWASYYYVDRMSSEPGFNVTSDTVLVGISKKF